MGQEIKRNYTLGLLMSVYGGSNSEFLQICLESIENQTSKLDECVIVIDGPICPKIRSILEAWKYRNCTKNKLLELEINSGLSKALNFGMKNMHSSWVMRFDSDDIMDERRVEIMRAQILSNRADIYGAYVKLISDYANNHIVKRPLSHEDISKKIFMAPVNHITAVFDRKKILEAGGYNENIPRRHDDFELWPRLHKYGLKFENIPEIVAFYRHDIKDFRKTTFSIVLYRIYFLLSADISARRIKAAIFYLVPLLRSVLPEILLRKMIKVMIKYDPRK